VSVESGWSPSQRAMVELWEEYTAHEFEDHSTEKIRAITADDPVDINVPLLGGGALPAVGARKLLDPGSVPHALLIERAEEEG
jgi:hypothetical protein